MKPLDVKNIHQVRINNLDKWESEFNEKRYIKDKIWKTRVMIPVTRNLAHFIDKYAKNRLELPCK